MKNNDYNLNDEPNLPLDNNGKSPFGLPKDYFSKFEENIKKKIELENELQEFPVLSSIEKVKPFIVPLNYFNLLKIVWSIKLNWNLIPIYNLLKSL
jgi:hypothetical protein